MESVESMKSAIDRVERLLAEGRCAFVAIDGPCASGKTVFAASLHERFGGNVLHMDDFFLRPEQRTPERFAEPGSRSAEAIGGGKGGTVPAVGLPYRRFCDVTQCRTGRTDRR